MNTQIYIADLAAYNAGYLRGRWIEAAQPVEDLQQEVSNMLLESPQSNIPCTVCNDCGNIDHYQSKTDTSRDLATINGWDNPRESTCSECGSHDLRGTVTAEEFAIHDTDGLDVGEYSSLQTVSDLATAIDEQGEAYQAYIDLVGSEYATLEGFSNAYVCESNSELDYAYQYIEDTGMLSDLPESMSLYFDYESFSKNLFMDGYSFIDGFIFQDC